MTLVKSLHDINYMQDFFRSCWCQEVGSLSLHGGLFLIVVGVKGGVPEVGLRLGVENGLHLLKHLLQLNNW